MIRLPRNVWVFLGYFGLSLIWYAHVLPPDRFFMGYDLEAAGYADRAFVAEGFRRGEIRFWNPDVLGGMPTFAGMMLEFFYLSRPLWLVMDVDQVYKWDFIISTVLAAFFFYLLLSALGVQISLALAGGLAAGFGWIPSMAFAGHITKVYVYTWFPLLLLFLYRGVLSLRIRPFLYAAGILGLMLWAQHLQMAYYAYLAAGVWVLFWTLGLYGKAWSQVGKSLLLFVGSVVLGVWMGVAGWLPGLLYVRGWSIRASAHRGMEFAASWSASWQDVLSVWIPRFSGLSVGWDSYWGDNPFRHDLAYGGIVALLGLLVGVVLWRRRRIRDIRVPLFVILGELLLFVLIVVANRTPAFSVFYGLFPFFKVLRAHSMALVYVATFATLLGTLLLDRGFRERILPARELWVGVIVLAVVGLWAVSSPSGFGHFMVSLFGVAPEKARAAALAAPAIGRALLWMALVLGGIQIGGISWGWMVPLLVGGEMFVLTRPFVTPAPAMRIRMQEDPVIRAVRRVMEDVGQPSRVLPLGYRTGESNWELWNIATAGGMFPFLPRTYAEWIGTQGFVLNILSFRNIYIRPELADLSGISVVVAPALPDSATLEARYRDHPQYPFLMALRRFLSRLEWKSRLPGPEGPLDIFGNPHTAGLFAFYSRTKRISPDSTGMHQILTSPDDLHRVLLLSDTSAPEIQPGDTLAVSPRIDVKRFEPGHALVEVEVPRKGFLFFAQNYYPQWEVRVDGKKTRLYRAFHTFMAVEVPGGHHRVEWRYVPHQEMRAWAFALIGVLVWLSSLIVSTVFLRQHEG